MESEQIAILLDKLLKQVDEDPSMLNLETSEGMVIYVRLDLDSKNKLVIKRSSSYINIEFGHYNNKYFGKWPIPFLFFRWFYSPWRKWKKLKKKCEYYLDNKNKVEKNIKFNKVYMDVFREDIDDMLLDKAE